MASGRGNRPDKAWKCEIIGVFREGWTCGGKHMERWVRRKTKHTTGKVKFKEVIKIPD